MSNFMLRIQNTPIKSRLFQIVNASIVAVAGDALQIVHVMEYPKCGGSWVRNMLHSYLGGDKYLIDRFISRRSVVHGHRLYRKMYSNPIVVLRDPRDIFVSFYFYETHYLANAKNHAISKYFTHNPSCPVKDDFAGYLEAKLSHTTNPQFSFGQFVSSWSDRPGVHFVKYEDLLANPTAELTGMLEFVRVPIVKEKIQSVVAYHSFENVTKRRYGTPRAQGEQDPRSFQRKGVSGDWRNYFNEKSCALINEFEWASMRKLGYETDPSWAEVFLRTG